MRIKSTWFRLRSAIISADFRAGFIFGRDSSRLCSEIVPECIPRVLQGLPSPVRNPAKKSHIPVCVPVFTAFFAVFDVLRLLFSKTELYYFLIITARWCNGSTSDSGSFSLGSSPGRAATSSTSLLFSSFSFPSQSASGASCAVVSASPDKKGRFLLDFQSNPAIVTCK